ncbi:MAG: hypothetical protein HUU06_01685 [Planctomycetaceae bacterium]|nr:hypothetical protein [Planctomycetaceae bacterium]
MMELTEWLVGAQDGLGGFGYTSPIMMAPHDHSNTQFSLLALGAARRSGIPVPEKTWQRALSHLLDRQERKGPPTVRYEDAESPIPGDAYGKLPRAGVHEDRSRGWGYRDGDPATGSMTAGGVSSIALCVEALSANGTLGTSLRKRSDQSIRDGISWLGHHFSVRDNPGPEGAPMGREYRQYYYLFGMERAGDLAGVKYMGAKDWYLEGAKYLVEAQGSDGSWASTAFMNGALGTRGGAVRVGGDLRDTCFALLFLKRAMLRGAKGTPTAEGAIDLSGASGLTGGDYSSLFDAVFVRYARAEATARPERATDFVRLGARSLPLLVLRLEDPNEELREAAIAALKHFTGLTQGFDPRAPENARAAAVRSWEEWWMAHKSRLVADVEAGRFLEK